MSDDDRSFIDKIEKTWTNWNGDEWSPDKALDHFALYDVPSRVDALEQLDREMDSADTSNLRAYSRLGRLRTDVNRLHQAMLKAGR